MSFGEYFGALSALGESYRKGLDQYEAPDLLRQLLPGQGGAQNGLATLLSGASAQPVPTGNALTTLGAGPAPVQSPLPAFARLQGGQPSAKIGGLLDAASQAYGLSPDYLPKVAMIESRFDPNARNPSGAAGLLQFMPKTAAQYGLDNPLDPAASADAGARLTVDNAKVLRAALGREPTNGELYLGHQQGAGGAIKLLRNPDAPAASIVGLKAVTQNGGTPQMSARDFAGLWTSKLDGDAANKPAGGAVPAGFVIPGGGGQVGLPGMPTPAQRNLDPELLARALTNSVTAPFATAALGNAFKSGDDYSLQAVGDSAYRFNKRTGSVELVPGVTKPQTTTLGQGQQLVDQATGRVIASVAAKPDSLGPGHTLYDPVTHQPIVTAPEKSGTRSFQQMNGRLLVTDPDTGTARDVTPADLPQGYRPATAEERGAFKVKDDVPLFIGPDGKPQTLAGQNITVNAGERAQDAAIGGDYGKRFAEMMRAGAGANGQLATIGTMERAMNTPGFYSGTGGPAHLAFNRALSSLPGGFKDPKKVAPNELFDALSNRVILDGLGGSLGAGISNGDRDFIQRTAPDLAKTPEGNAQLLGYARAMAERQQQVAAFARQYYARNGNKLDPGFDTALQAWADANPITPGGRRASQPSPSTGQPSPQRQAPAGPSATDLDALEAEARRRGLIR